MLLSDANVYDTGCVGLWSGNQEEDEQRHRMGVDINAECDEWHWQRSVKWTGVTYDIQHYEQWFVHCIVCTVRRKSIQVCTSLSKKIN